MRICFLLIFSVLASLSVSAQTTKPASATTAPPARQLTPAEEKQKQKQAEWLRKELEFRTMWAAKERARAEKEAQREREKAAKRAGKPVEAQPASTPEPTPADAPKVVTPKPQTAPQPAATPQPDPQAEAAKRAQTDQKNRERAAQIDAANRKTQADATEKAQREADRKAQKEADAAAKAARKAERQRKTDDPVAPPTVTPAPAQTAPAAPEKPIVATPKPAPVVRPARVRQDRVRLDSPALSADIQPDSVLSRMPTTVFLPAGHLFEPLVLDPIQSQTSFSILPVFQSEGVQSRGSIVPFTFGFDKPIFRRYRDRNRTDEFAIDAASFTQFQVYHDPTENINKRKFLNSDYRVSFLYNFRRYNHVWRLRLYHLSSHLGDDFIFQNQIAAPTANSVNYEVVDLTYSLQTGHWRLYGGAGFGLRQWSERKPISAEAGVYYRRSIKPMLRMVGGVDVKVWQQTQYQPGIKAGWGIELGRANNYFTFLLEAYTGFRPYSQYENQTVTWFGISTYLNPF